MTDRRNKEAGLWEDLDKKNGAQSVATPTSTQNTDPSKDPSFEVSKDIRPFEDNATPELMGLYRALMKLSKIGPLTSQPARLLVKVMQELMSRGAKL